MNLTLKSRLSLVNIKIRKENKNYIVEDINLQEFYEMPEVCIEAIRMINNQNLLEEIEKMLIIKYPDLEINILDFAQQLVDLGLVKEIDSVGLEFKQSVVEQQSFLWLPSYIGRIFFNKIALLIFSILLILDVILIFYNPHLFPKYSDLFVFDWMALNIPIWIIINSVLVLFHEFGHVLAMRAYNLPTKLGIGHRMFLVVLETDMTPGWKLPSKNRNILYLAGLCVDTVILFLSLIIQLLYSEKSGIFYSVQPAIVLSTFIRIIYQCCVYMKTDLYFVIENSTGCYNLMENAQHLIRKRLSFLKGLKTEVVIFDGESNIVTMYSIFYFIGVFLTVVLYVGFYIPQLVYAFRKTLPGLGLAPTTIDFWDALLFMMQVLIMMGLLLYSWRKKYLLKDKH
jgi:putative peptide zinc metalloprotease protein